MGKDGRNGSLARALCALTGFRCSAQFHFRIIILIRSTLFCLITISIRRTEPFIDAIIITEPRTWLKVIILPMMKATTGDRNGSETTLSNGNASATGSAAFLLLLLLERNTAFPFTWISLINRFYCIGFSGREPAFNCKLRTRTKDGCMQEESALSRANAPRLGMSCRNTDFRKFTKE